MSHSTLILFGNFHNNHVSAYSVSTCSTLIIVIYYFLFFFTLTGSLQTWHGYAGIILNQNIAVSLIECPSKEKNLCIETDDKFEEENLSDPIQINKDEESGPSSPKRICKDDNDNEEKETQSQQMIDQVIAQTITNAFSQVSKTPALSGWLIPTFGCALDHVIALLYDPKNDVLLQCVDKIPIWGFNGLYLPSIVQIWMFLNFTVFTFKDLADDYELKRSNFHVLAKYRLEDYRKIKPGKAFNPTYDCDYYSDVLIRMRKKGKKAHKKLAEH